MAADNIINNEMINGVFGANDPNDDSLPQYSLFYEVKSNLTHERLSRLVEGGVRWVQPGIESLDDEVLAMMDKGVTALQNVRFLRNCSELGIIPIWNLLWGFPGEGDRHYAAMAQMDSFH